MYLARTYFHLLLWCPAGGLIPCTNRHVPGMHLPGFHLLLLCFAGGLIRNIFKNLEAVGLMEKSSAVRGGRRLTASGQRDMDLIACRITNPLPVL